MSGKHKNQIFIYRQDLLEHAGLNVLASRLSTALWQQTFPLQLVHLMNLHCEHNTWTAREMLILCSPTTSEKNCKHILLPTTLHTHPLTFAAFLESPPLCSSLPPSQASAPVPSNQLNHQKAFFSAPMFFLPRYLKTVSWFLTTHSVLTKRENPLEAVHHPSRVCGTGVGSTFKWCHESLRGKTGLSSPLFCGLRIQWRCGGEYGVEVFLNVHSTMQPEPLELVSSSTDPVKRMKRADKSVESRF